MARVLKFYPNVSPREMVEQGVFGGSYFGPNAGPDFSQEQEELCEELFTGLDPQLYRGDRYLPKRNRYKIRSGKDYKFWSENNWIHPRDPFGWFEWYCKYSQGVRGEDDGRQIRRWQEFTGINGRWRNNLYNKIYKSGDWSVSPRIQQSLLHWGYQANEEDFKLWCKTNKL